MIRDPISERPLIRTILNMRRDGASIEMIAAVLGVTITVVMRPCARHSRQFGTRTGPWWSSSLRGEARSVTLHTRTTLASGARMLAAVSHGQSPPPPTSNPVSWRRLTFGGARPALSVTAITVTSAPIGACRGETKTTDRRPTGAVAEGNERHARIEISMRTCLPWSLSPVSNRIEADHGALKRLIRDPGRLSFSYSFNCFFDVSINVFHKIRPRYFFVKKLNKIKPFIHWCHSKKNAYILIKVGPAWGGSGLGHILVLPFYSKPKHHPKPHILNSSCYR